jgi:hypothetical protein
VVIQGHPDSSEHHLCHALADAYGGGRQHRPARAVAEPGSYVGKTGAVDRLPPDSSDAADWPWGEERFWLARAKHNLSRFRTPPVEDALEFGFEVLPGTVTS